MKKIIVSLLAAMLALPLLASAHAHYNYEINGVVYEFTIGSLGEPIAVDDRTGVELRVVKLGEAVVEEEGHQEEAAGHAEEGTPAVGLETSLKVEIEAGAVKKVFDLVPTYGTLGSYYAKFYPTVQTTYTYRIFGTIEETPFEFSATCTPAGHARAEEDTSRVPVSDKVVRVLQSGGFGCPVGKADLGFPEQAAPNADLTSAVASQGAELETVAREFRFVEIALGFLVVAFAAIELRRRRM